MRHNAEDRLSQQRNPAYRLASVTVDLWTAQNDLRLSVATIKIGAESGLPTSTTRSPTSQVDLIVEGWTDTISASGYTVTFDTSAADNPPRMVWDDTSYGSWQCDGQTLSASIANSATTLAIATSAGKPTFTTSAGAYPLTIQIEQEEITLTSAPSGSTSPQTFTGVTRGVNGTTAAAQTAGATVNLAPADTWALWLSRLPWCSLTP